MRAPAIKPRAALCPTCGRQYSSATTSPECPKTADQRRETARAERLLGITRMPVESPENNRATWDNKSGPRGAINTAEGLTRISELSRNGLGMKPTRPSPATPADGAQ